MRALEEGDRLPSSRPPAHVKSLSLRRARSTGVFALMPFVHVYPKSTLNTF